MLMCYPIGQRRFPLPRVDLYSTGMMRHFIPPHISLTPTEKLKLIEQIVAKKSTEDIAWHERQVVPFKHKLDRLPTLTKIWRQNEKTDNGRPYHTPPASEYGDDDVDEEDFAVQEGAAIIEEGYGAGDGFSSDGEVIEDEYGYNTGTTDQDQAETDIGGRVRYSSNIPEAVYAVDENGVVHRQVYNEQDSPVEDYGFEPYTGGNIYDGLGLPMGYSNGVDGPGDGVRPPPGGWLFDQVALRERGAWAEILDEIDFVVDAEA
ncbi:hypothetical protein ONS95_007067 [Cadophora gregata]|uniref:uncharacterized protein n=1 Tax=Cadophora gregata TaxID=51156 RepID=UPI0026DCC662|nr:uncharacterized protein ONS95_007067 [Cadophora gregata]KAK0100612.1 hypothetical protein ONS95_007067 [Cadophora gregata]KAK0117389.1 hypothetical protein ONS96_013219 [Cadophora gregata f. sp. sojae]